MKPIAVAVFMLGALVAGAFGGVATTSLFSPPAPTVGPPARQAAPAPTAGDRTAISADESSEIAALKAQHADELEVLRVQLDTVSKRLASLESAGLVERVSELDRRVAAAPPPASAGSESAPGAAAPAVSADDPAFRAALEAALDARETERREKEMADRRVRMQEGMAMQAKQILDSLAQKVALSDDQKARIGTILDAQSKRRMEVMERGMKARENNEPFDWPGEMGAVASEATQQVRAELDASQQATFDQAVGDQGIDALGGFGAMRMGGGPPGGPRR
ncbi:MAG: hypothetical protein AB7K09_05265 [Planctomycetota bacterium]